MKKSRRTSEGNRSHIEKILKSMQNPIEEATDYTDNKMRNVLEPFRLFEVLSLLSRLELLPRLHANIFRIEVLINMACTSCKGECVATVDDLNDWLAILSNSEHKYQEDPSEDIFIGYICSKFGGFRTFAGIFANGDFWLERIIEFLKEKTETFKLTQTFEEVLAILTLSDAIAEAAGLSRYMAGSSNPGQELKIDPVELTEGVNTATIFDSKRLATLGIDVDMLSRFILDDEKKGKMRSEDNIGSIHEKYPLIKQDATIVVFSPASLCRAALVAIIDDLQKLPHDLLDLFFGIGNAEFFVNEILPPLKIEINRSIRLPAQPKSLRNIFPVVGQFDYGKPVFGFVIYPSFGDGSDLEKMASFSEQERESLEKYIEECCKASEAVQGFEGGLILVGVASIGKPMSISFKSIPDRWNLIAGTLAELQTLCRDEDFDAFRLWRLSKQLTICHEANVRLINPSGLINLYGFWKENRFTLLHEDIDPSNPQNMMVLSGEYCCELNEEMKQLDDRHCRMFHNTEDWVILRRKAKDLNPDLESNRRYGDFDSATVGVLRGCVEREKQVWWIQTVQKAESAASRDLQYRLWECILNWVDLSINYLLDFSDLGEPKSVLLSLSLPGLEEWDWQKITPSTSRKTIKINTNRDSSEIILEISVDFISEFYRVENFAEQSIVENIIRSYSVILGYDISDVDVNKLVKKITKGIDSRFFHVVRVTALESLVADPGSANPTFVPEEEMARARIGLSHLIGEKAPKKITDQSVAAKLLFKAVAELQKRIVHRLSVFQLSSVVTLSFRQLDELARDSSRWVMSTRSLLSLEEGQPWIHGELRGRRGQLALAEIVNRVIIETAVYSCNNKVNQKMSLEDHSSILAEIAVMIDIANYADAVQGGFVSAGVEIHANGIISYDNTGMEEVFVPYMVSRLDDDIKSASDAYETYFESDEQNGENREQTPEVKAFAQAFQAEYGFSPDVLSDILDWFSNSAIERGTTAGIIDVLSLRRILHNRIGMNDAAIEKFFERFSLPIRPMWDQKFPKGCDKSDVLPWRFWRGLSVLMRPLVEVSKAPRRFVVSASHLSRWHRYLITSIAEGYLPAKIFRSTSMHSYLGKIAQKKGDEFTQAVANLARKSVSGCKTEVKMEMLGAPMLPDLGDIDVILWNEGSSSVVLIECKRLKKAITVRAVIQQLEDFKGDIENEDYLGKHKRRVEWIGRNREKISEMTKIDSNSIIISSLLVTRGRVPMSFRDAIDFPAESVVAFSDFEDVIRGIFFKSED